MVKKYELLQNDTVTTADGKTLYRIRALRAITDVVKPGDLGGYVECEANLSHFEDCWVADEAWVFDHARVSGNAWVREHARIYDYADISYAAEVYGNARVFGNAHVTDCALVYGNAWVHEYAWVCDFSSVYGDAWVNGSRHIGRKENGEQTHVFKNTWGERIDSLIRSTKDVFRLMFAPTRATA